MKFLGKYAQALKLLLPMEKKYSNSAVINGVLGEVYYQKKEFEKSVHYFTKTIHLGSKSELASLALYHSYKKLGLFDTAMKEMQRFLLSNEPKDYKITIKELFEGIDETTDEEEREIIENWYNKFIIGK